jgi:DNA-binding NarL/FixJ family response regulator
MESNCLLVEPNDILRNGLSCALAERRSLARITEARDCARGLSAAEREPFSIAILGAGLEDDERHDLLGSLARVSPRACCILILCDDSWSEVERAMRSRAVGILCMDSPAQELWTALESAQRGVRYICPSLQRRLLASLGIGPGAPARSPASLTKREHVILNRIGMGGSNREIAAELGLSRRTVDTHRTRLMKKLGVHNTAALVRFAVREGLIEA